MTHHAPRNFGERRLKLEEGEAAPLDPTGEAGTGKPRDAEKVASAALIGKLNDLYGTDLTDGDLISWARTLMAKVLEDERLRQQARANSREQFAVSPTLDRTVRAAELDCEGAHSELAARTIDSAAIHAGPIRVMLDQMNLWGRLRAAG